MSDTSGLPNADADGVPAEDRPERFEEGAQGATADGSDAPAGATGTDQAEPPPADFDPADRPSNPDLVGDAEPPD